jgi:hypothetical protein
MKTIISMLSFAAIATLTACGNNNNTEQSTEQKSDSTSQTTPNNAEAKKGGSVNDIVSGYLDLKNALTNDNGNDAATAAKKITTAIANVDESALAADQKKVYGDVKDDIKEHAEHIGSSGSNIAHQREHFDLLSQDVIDLVKATGTTQTLYRDFCPMYNNKKGAPWLSETKEIKNPYYGKEMPKCGEVKEEIKAKG